MMTPRKETPKEGRVDYRWRVDRDGGFEKATLIYDRDGRLVAMDYEVPPRQARAEFDRSGEWKHQDERDEEGERDRGHA